MPGTSEINGVPQSLFDGSEHLHLLAHLRFLALSALRRRLACSGYDLERRPRGVGDLHGSSVEQGGGLHRSVEQRGGLQREGGGAADPNFEDAENVRRVKKCVRRFRFTHVVAAPASPTSLPLPLRPGPLRDDTRPHL